MRRLPFIPTLVVATAVATMSGLGIWQLRRAEEKTQLIAQLEAAARAAPIGPSEIADFEDPDKLHLRRMTMRCDIGRERIDDVIPGRSATGQPGYLYIVDCLDAGPLDLPHGPPMLVVGGWLPTPDGPTEIHVAGNVTGVLKAGRSGADLDRYTLVPDAGIPPLKAARQPSVEDIPNNHLLYAFQWFFFAAAALVIYVLALRQRLSEAD